MCRSMGAVAEAQGRGDVNRASILIAAQVNYVRLPLLA
jgi:hypothetical protein